MLSTMLGVTCGRGNSVAEVLDCLRRAASADFSSPTGTIYFMKNGDVRSTTREWGFNPAVDAIGRLGVRAVVEEGVLPQNSDGVAGAMIGSAGFDWVSCHSTILPGAICEHLTSFGGIIAERADQTPCTDLIRAGAAGTSGTVTEPYALQQKFPTPFIQLQYVQGFTLAEAFYLSLSGPYQLLVVGDPLCKPWAKPLRVSVSGLPAGGIVKEALSLKATVSRPADVATFELYVDGKFAAQAQPGTPLKLETAGLPAGYHALSVVAVENNPAESRARVSMPVTIARRGESVGEFGPKSRSAALGEKVAVTLSCGGASSIDVVQFGRTLATVQGAKGTATVDTNDLGIGAAQLVPVAHVAGGEVMGAPIEVVVDQPAPGTPSAESGAATEPGLVLTTGGSRAVVQDTFDSAWLSKLCPGPAQSFVLAGDFEAPKDELYQVQIRTNTRALVEIDGSKAASVGDEKWHCVLVALRAGNHALAVHGVAPAGAVLDVRLGAAGAYHLAAQRFHHLLR
jgi:hypothetical protein